MTRTDALKGVYVARVCGLLVCGVAAPVAAQNGAIVPAIALGVLFVAMVLSGRIQAYFWSDLLAGLHALNQREYQMSKVHSERFLVNLRERPWLRRLIWLGTSSYSLNAEVLALNNLGAAELALGEFDSARAHLNQAITSDPQCPLPCRNMGTLTLRTSSTAEAMPWFERAEALGLRRGLSDRVIMSSQRRNAELSTTGVVTDVQPSRPPEQPVTGAYIVYLLNDEKTPFEFAVTSLESVFGMTGERAIHTAISVDKTGRAACAGFEDGQVAQDKVDEMNALARAHGHQLTCIIEPDRP